MWNFCSIVELDVLFQMAPVSLNSNEYNAGYKQNNVEYYAKEI
jgi:hypothetical protein